MFCFIVLHFSLFLTIISLFSLSLFSAEDQLGTADRIYSFLRRKYVINPAIEQRRRRRRHQTEALVGHILQSFSSPFAQKNPLERLERKFMRTSPLREDMVVNDSRTLTIDTKLMRDHEKKQESECNQSKEMHPSHYRKVSFGNPFSIDLSKISSVVESKLEMQKELELELSGEVISENKAPSILSSLIEIEKNNDEKERNENENENDDDENENNENNENNEHNEHNEHNEGLSSTTLSEYSEQGIFIFLYSLFELIR